MIPARTIATHELTTFFLLTPTLALTKSRVMISQKVAQQSLRRCMYPDLGPRD